MPQPNHEWKTDKYLEAEEILGADLGQWIDGWRYVPDEDTRRPSWQTIARELWAKTDVAVSHETIRAWHTAWSAHTPIEKRRAR